MPSSFRPTFDYEPVTRSRSSANDATLVEDEVVGHCPDEVSSDKQTDTPSDKEPKVITRAQPRGGLGHGITFAGFVLFTFLLYFRPYEFIPALMGFPGLTFWVAVLTLCAYVPTQLAYGGNLTERPREVNYLLLFTLAALLSIPLAVSPSEAWDTFYNVYLKFALMCIVIINVVRNRRRLQIMFWLALICGATLSLGAINEYVTGNLTVEGYRAKGVIGSVFGDPNDMALFLVMMAPIALCLALGQRGILKKVICLTLVVLYVAGISVTYSRGGFLGLVAISLVLAWKLGRRRRFVVLGSLIFAILTFMTFAPGNYWLRMLSIFVPSLDPHGSATARKDLLFAGFKNVVANPVFGLGMGNYHLVSARSFVNHNAYLEVATELGLFALCMYIAFMIAPIRRLSAIERSTQPRSDDSWFFYLSIGLQASIVGYMVTSFFLSVAYYWNIYYLVGFAVCLRLIYEEKHKVVIQPRKVSVLENDQASAPGPTVTERMVTTYK